MRAKQILALALAALLLTGCGRSSQPAEERTVPTQKPTMEETLPPETEPEETTPPPKETEEPTEPAFRLHSGIREDGTFDEGTLFIGDFLTYGLVTGYLTDRELLGDAKYMVIPSGALTAFDYGPVLTRDTDCLYSPEFEGMLMREAVEEAGDSVTAVYFMMGTNFSKYADDETLTGIVEHILACCPNATVFLQLVPYDRSTRVDYEEANRRVLLTYMHYQQEANPRVRLIDTQTAIGYNLTTDGIQLTTEGQACWYQALVAFADGNHIPQ